MGPRLRLALAIPFPYLLLSPALLLRGAPIQPSRLWSLSRRYALLKTTILTFSIGVGALG